LNSENSDINLGIDVSKYQKGLDFSAIKAAGIAHVCIQITEGTSYINPHWQQHCQDAKAQGLNIGFYHSFTPGVNAAAQAQYFFQAISGISYDCLPMLNVERDGRYEAEELPGEVHACVNEIAYLTGYMTIIYTSTSFALNNLKANYVDMYPLWEAEYNTWGYPGTNFT
jgi:lysozyme